MLSFNCGATPQFSTVFKDKTGAVAQPGAAKLTVKYAIGGVITTVDVNMTGPTLPATNWTAQWDSRKADPGVVEWAVYNTDASIPYSVERGRFELLADVANLPAP